MRYYKVWAHAQSTRVGERVEVEICTIYTSTPAEAIRKAEHYQKGKLKLIASRWNQLQRLAGIAKPDRTGLKLKTTIVPEHQAGTGRPG